MTYSKVIWGLLLSFVVGFCCHLAAIPVPSPPVMSGALLVFTMSSGYWLVDRYLAAKAANNAPANAATDTADKDVKVQA